METTDSIQVWDVFVRFFHWTLVLAFTVAYVVEDELLSVHIGMGYFIGMLLCARILWGVIGTRHARFSDFVTSPGRAFGYLREALVFRANRYVGHNPAGGLMIVLLLMSLAITVISGIAVLGVEENSGPLAGVLAKAWHDPVEELHEFMAEFTVFLVFVHLAGVIVESFLHQENLIVAMITGKKKPLDQ